MGNLPGPDRTSAIIDKDMQIHQQTSRTRFQMFFAGLIFAVLSFIGAHPIQLNNIFFKWIEIISLFLLLISGMILLAQLSELRIAPKELEKITCRIKIKCINFINIHVLSRQWLYWLLFLLGMTLIIIDRSAALLA